MKINKTLTLGAIMVVALTLSGCRGPVTNVTDLRLGTSLDSNGEVATDLGKILPASAKTIYLSGHVKEPAFNTVLLVRWSREGEVLSSQRFTGSRGEETPFEFENSKKDSVFYAELSQEGLTWLPGQYLAELFIGDELVDSRSFEFKFESDFTGDQVKRNVSDFAVGNKANVTNQVVTSKSSLLARTTPDIYAGVVFNEPVGGVKVATRWEFVSGGVQLTTLERLADPRTNALLFDLPLSRFGRLWPDNLWAKGLYRVTLMVDGSDVMTREFRID